MNSAPRPTPVGVGSWEEANNCVEGPFGDAANARRRRRLAGFRALDVLSVFSAVERVRKCRRLRTGTDVAIVHRATENRAHFAGLQTCGSVWACPCCSERILAGRAAELVRAIQTHAAADGDVLMLTLTMRHNRRQALADLWDGLTSAWTAARSGARKHLQGVMWVKRTEGTHGAAGWHMHLHVLLFVPAGTPPQAIGEAMFAAWAKRLVSLGFDAPQAGPGMQIKRLDLANATEEVAAYLAKGHYDEQLADDPARRAALELASNGKRARGENRTPMQILAAFVANGEASDLQLWHTWEKASKGRQAMTWSAGAHDHLVGDEEQTDDELAQETDGGGTVVALIDGRAWSAIAARPHLMNDLLTLVEVFPDHLAWNAVDDRLAAAGLAGALIRPPPDRVGG